MNEKSIKLLVLDAHGVVLTNPLMTFLDELAAATGQSPAVVKQRWQSELRTPAWTGQLAEDELWRNLTNGAQPQRWRDQLEERYELGPAAGHLKRWSRRVPIWMLSNHCSRWLLPRLERFELKPFFQRVIISDMIGAAKPSPAAFQPIVEQSRQPSSVLFVDDRKRNVLAAARLGIQTIHASPDVSWASLVDQCLEKHSKSGAKDSRP